MLKLLGNRMKAIILLTALFTFNSFASSNYQCSFRNYILDLDMTNDRSTGLFIKERYRYETLYVGYAGSIQRNANTSDFYFYGQSGEHILTFKNSDLKNEPAQMKGRIEATLEGFYIVDTFTCYKR